LATEDKEVCIESAVSLLLSAEPVEETDGEHVEIAWGESAIFSLLCDEEEESSLL
jgi:hypothetical protein